MDFHQLFIFTKVVEQQSFSKAAEEVFLSQSTVSSHIQSLEKQLTLRLFDRKGRDVIVTSHGERLYHWAQQLLQLKERALLDLNENTYDIRGPVRIAASSVPGSYIIPEMMKRFHHDYPNVVFHLHTSSSKTVITKVLNRSVDFGILGQKCNFDQLCYFPIQKEKLVLITPNDMHLPKKVTFQDFVHYPLIMRDADSGTQTMINKLLRKNNMTKNELHIVAYTDSEDSLIQLVKKGLGIAIVSEISAKEYEAKQFIQMCELTDFAEERYFYLVYHQNKTLSIPAKLFIQSIKDFTNKMT